MHLTVFFAFLTSPIAGMTAITATMDQQFLKDNRDFVNCLILILIFLYFLSIFAGKPVITYSEKLPRSGIRVTIGLILLIVCTTIEKVVFLQGLANQPTFLNTGQVICVYAAAFLGFALFSREAVLVEDIDYIRVAIVASIIFTLAVCSSTVTAFLLGNIFFQILFDIQIAAYLIDLYYVFKHNGCVSKAKLVKVQGGVDKIEFNSPDW